MSASDEYVVHTDYEAILAEVDGLKAVDEGDKEKIRGIVAALRAIGQKLKPALRRGSLDQDERELWRYYQRLQEERLSLLDLSHEWGYLEETVGGLSQDVRLLMKDAVEELIDHVTILAETHRAHIDILEIQNSRRLSVTALVVSATLAYLAVWEFFAREFVMSLVFPDGLSPVLNYVISAVSLVPVFMAIVWAWRSRVARVQ